MKTEIIIENLDKFYGKKQALNRVSLTIEQGMFGLLGRNGAGKTTLMKLLASLLQKDGGEIQICGIPVSNSKEIRKITGYLPQEFSMYGSMGAYEALDYLGVLSGLKRSIRKERIPKLLEQVNLENCRRMKIKAMSGGMKRRLGIAQALLHDPKVLIVDEPTAGLDPEERIRFRNLLSEVAEDRIVILSTHIVGDIEAACENVAVLDEGTILFSGKLMDLQKNAEGKIYQAVISKKELDLMKKQYTIISIIHQANEAIVRFCSEERPFKGTVPCEANAEDAYMYLMQEKEVRDNAAGAL